MPRRKKPREVDKIEYQGVEVIIYFDPNDLYFKATHADEKYEHAEAADRDSIR